ncbi:hypothetical protein PCASD_00907 [Puccinia coronata f. sp. avenae]|uniref:Fucosyltransferase n=1 Tax=Puccinia coronata f. sp. avenae TaxID=200324 RepID=A0A2N5VPF0_9BASI|nr:hypothetical protein PCASD_00907 [Puccinia coronata f. sp. avenae]
MDVPKQGFIRALSPLQFVKDLLSHRPARIEYEKIPSSKAGNSMEAITEQQIPLYHGPQRMSARARYFEKRRWRTFSLATILIVTAVFVLIAWRRAQPANGTTLQPIRTNATILQSIKTNGTWIEPIKIHFKAISQKYSDVECDTPVKIVADEAEAQVVIWSSANSGVNISEHDGEKLRRQKPGQLHGFWSLENEEYYPEIKKAREDLAAGDAGAFDFGVTYKTTSDFPIPYAYSFIDFRKVALPFESRRQDKMAAAFISNCSPMNNRTSILQSLIDLLPGQIDSFGGCLGNADADEVIKKLDLNPVIPGQEHQKLSPWNEKMSIIGRYKFTIAFENANEEDYVTEKYYQALSAGSIPIHLGQTTDQFEKFKPSPNSALNVAEFKSVEELANRIKQLSNDRASYESMLDWKTQPFPQRFNEILEWGKVSEACRIGKFLRKKWRNPHALKQERYDSFYQRLNLTTS